MDASDELRNNHVPANRLPDPAWFQFKWAGRGFAKCTNRFIEAHIFMPPLKAYLVEDSPVIRENLIAALEELAPVQVVGTAEDEPTAVHWLSRSDHACDLVIIDIFLKRGSGLGVLRSVTELRRPMSLVVLSNYATPDMRRKCLDLGASRVFDKSNEIDALISYCARLAGGETALGTVGSVG